MYERRRFFWMIAELAWKVIDEGEKGEKVVAWYSTICLAL